MTTAEQLPDIMTPEQAAEYLQTNRETVYRYIRQGKLAAERLGRKYRISKKNIDLLLWDNPSRPNIKLREFTTDEIEQWVESDRLGDEEKQIVARFVNTDPLP